MQPEKSRSCVKRTITLAAALAVLALPSIAEAASKKRHHHSRAGMQAYARSQPQIACTQFGCMNVPRGCASRPGRTWDDMPSGFDVIVCRGGVSLYGNY
jgi:hypothetical protein